MPPCLLPWDFLQAAVEKCASVGEFQADLLGDGDGGVGNKAWKVAVEAAQALTQSVLALPAERAAELAGTLFSALRKSPGFAPTNLFVARAVYELCAAVAKHAAAAQVSALQPVISPSACARPLKDLVAKLGEKKVPTVARMRVRACGRACMRVCVSGSSAISPFFSQFTFPGRGRRVRFADRARVHRRAALHDRAGPFQ